MSKKYKVIKNKDEVYSSTGGIKVTVPRSSEYSIYWVDGGHMLKVLDIKDHFVNPKNIGEGICELLNKGKIVLDLK